MKEESGNKYRVQMAHPPLIICEEGHPVVTTDSTQEASKKIKKSHPHHPKRDIGVDERLEAITFRNIVEFYAEELRAIQNGHRGRGVFTTSQRRGLRKKGIIINKPRSTRTRLTARAITLLAEMDG